MKLAIALWALAIGGCKPASHDTPSPDGGSGSGSDAGSDTGAPNACPGTSSGAKLIVPTFATGEVIVALKDVVADYGADPSGTTDATAAFTTAMNDVAALGGGTVWAPAGMYRFDGPLAIPPTVTLHGDWKQPTDVDKTVGGTIFAIDYTAAPFMTFTGTAAVEGASFWYPAQSLTAPIAATAIAFVPPQDGSKKQNVRSVTIANCTFVNPGTAIDTETYATDEGGSHNFFNIYGAALDTGVILRKTSSVSHNPETHLAARYWSDSGLAGSPAYADLAAYMQAHATGLVYFDNWGTYNVTIEDFATGIAFTGAKNDDVVTGQQAFGVQISNAHVALDLEQGNNFYLNNASLSATAGANPVAIYVNPQVGRTSVLLDEVTLASAGDDIDDESNTVTLNISHSVFSSWSGYAVAAAGADVIVAGSKFLQTGAGNKDLSLGAKIDHAIIMSNTFADGFTIDSSAPAKNVSIDQRPLQLAGGITGFASSGLGLRIEVPTAPQPARTGVGSLYDVTCFGAVSDCTSAGNWDADGHMIGTCTDNTAAIQAALDAASAAGGGTVYLPASTATGGYYVAGHLSVPTGVELLGSEQDRRFRDEVGRTVLIAEGDGDPFITLAARAGLRGFMVWYANQNAYNPGAFGYAVQARGAGAWVINLEVPNATNGLDFGTYGSDGHYIESFSSQDFTNPIYVSKSASGFIGDFDNGGGGGDVGVIDYPVSFQNPVGDTYDADGNMDPDGFTDTDSGQIADAYKAGVGILLGSAKHEVIVNAYVHSPHIGLKAIADGAGGGPSALLVHFGSETFTGLDLEALDPAGFLLVLSEYHTIATVDYPQSGGPGIGSPYLVIGSGVPATTPVTFLTLANHSYTPVGFDISGGAVIVQHYYSDLDTNGTGDIQTAIAVHGDDTGFALIGGKFINPLDPGYAISNDTSENVAFAGISLASALSTTGPIDLGFEPLFK